MLDKILPYNIYSVIESRIDMKNLNEIRLRANQPVVVFIGGQPYFLSDYGLTTTFEKAIILKKEEIEDVVFKASGNSIYSVNEQIKKGFLVVEGGIRIGVCGNVMIENEQVRTITDFSSLNIRIPHEIKNCSLSAFSSIVDEFGVNNTLILSPPGCGKTTFIRDFVWQLSQNNFCLNVLVLDERGEISGMGEMNLGKFCDVLSYTNKQQGFMQGIRSMSPNLIVTDELGGEDDIDALCYAMNCGVSVIATIHANSISQLKQKQGFKKLLDDKYFSRFVVLSSRQGPGTLEGVYNENLTRIVSWGWKWKLF